MRTKKERLFQVQEASNVAEVLNNSDVLAEILVRVPPKYVSIPILVSKLWCRLILCSSFCQLYTKRWRHSFPLEGFRGFFVRYKLLLGLPRIHLSHNVEYTHLFLPSSTHNDKDDDGKRFGFGVRGRGGGVFERAEHIVDSFSNGIILIGSHYPATFIVWDSFTRRRYQLPQPPDNSPYPYTFIVWDPFTRQRYQLPQPPDDYKYWCTAFVSQYYGDGLFHYKVIRVEAIVPFPCRIQIFSSETGEWEADIARLSSDLQLQPHGTATVIGGVIHVLCRNLGVAMCDLNRSRRGKWQFEFVSSPCCMKVMTPELGESSDGLLQYCDREKLEIKVWVLETNDNNYKWSLRYKIDFQSVYTKNMMMMTKFGCASPDEFSWVSFLRRCSDQVFLRLNRQIFLLDIATEDLHHISYECDQPITKRWMEGVTTIMPYYRWPCPWPYLNWDDDFRPSLSVRRSKDVSFL